MRNRRGDIDIDKIIGWSIVLIVLAIIIYGYIDLKRGGSGTIAAIRQRFFGA